MLYKNKFLLTASNMSVLLSVPLNFTIIIIIIIIR